MTGTASHSQSNIEDASIRESVLAFTKILTAYAGPMRLVADPHGELEQRNWVVRLHSEIQDGNEVEHIVDWVSSETHRQLRSMLNDSHGDVERMLPTIRVGLIDPLHLIITIVTIGDFDDPHHLWLRIPSLALAALDSKWPVDDVQGIPRRFWEMLLGSPNV